MTPRGPLRIGDGVFRVEEENGRSHLVYVATTQSGAWAFWNGRVFRPETTAPAERRPRPRGHAAQALTAPMPATVIKVLASAGDVVKKGDTVVVLEAMKMELPVRAPADATVKAVNCREGELVQPDAVLVELE